MSAITRAVLLAAGRGSRLGTLTESFPKAMLDVGGAPIIHHILDGLAAAGITSVSVVTGHAAEVLESATGDGSRWGIAVRYLRQPTPDGTARAVSLARPFLDERPFFVGWGDVVVEPSNYARVVSAGAEFGSALGVNHVEDPFAGAAVYADGDGRITRLVEKPLPGTSTTNWNNAGLAVLPDDTWPFIEALAPSTRGEYELPQAIAAFIAAGNPMRAVPIVGPWFDIGTPESLGAARAHYGHGN